MCGIIGIFRTEQKNDAASLAALGLFAEQHRGQESCGIAVSNGKKIMLEKEMGLVKEVFTEAKAKRLDGKIAIGHVRYPTKGRSSLENAQPHLVHTLSGPGFALSSNGDIVNYAEIRKFLENEAVFFESDNDGELILKYIAYWHIKKQISIISAIEKVMENFKGSFSTLLLTKNSLYAFRDPLGLRPFTFGKIYDGSFVFASETCCLNIIKSAFLRNVKPAEIIRIKENKVKSFSHDPDDFRDREHNAHCVFELIYFARPDSINFNHVVHKFRVRLGEKLAQNETIIPDVVVPIPDSSNFIGEGYAKKMGVEFKFGLIRNHYVGRTFIAPDQTIRDESVRQKFSPLPGFMEGKIITYVDDSIVRGTTMKKLVKLAKKNGAKEVHVRIGSPMVKHSCFYGIDTPTEEELIANNKNAEEIREYISADSLRYLSLAELRELPHNPQDFCYACFDGKYPI